MIQIKRLWQQMTKPPDTLDGFVARQMSQLLGSWLLAFIILLLILFIFRTASGVATTPELWARLVLCLLVVLAYVINRSGRYRLAGNLAAISSSLLLWALAITEGPNGLQILNYFTVIALFASLFLTPWSIFAILAMHTLGMALFNLFIEDVTLKQVIDGPLSFNLTIDLIIFIITRLRNRLEIERQAIIDWERRRFQHLAIQSPDFICLINSSTFAIEFINKQHFLGYTPNDFSSLNALFHLVHPQDLPRVRAHWKQVTRGNTNKVNEIEFQLKSKAGEWEWIQNRVTEIALDDEGESAQYLCLITIITERKAVIAAQKLESLGIMAGGVAHDFNNLLVAIMGQASLALRKLPADSPARSHIDKAVSAGNRAADITKQLLAYSGHGRFEIHPLNLNQLVQENINFLQVAIPKNVTIYPMLKPDLPLIEADIGQMQQIVMNLIQNGAEAIGTQPGTISIITDVTIIETEEDAPTTQYGFSLKPGRYVSLTINDNGQGMDRHTLSQLFEPFFTTKEMGRGLGLSAVLGIVRGHQGSITVHSKPDEGTKFTILFPAMT